jgi:hypothetical protein
MRDATKALAKGEVEQVGREILDQGIIGIIPRGNSKLLERLELKSDLVGKALGKTKDTLDDLAKKEGLTELGVKPLEVARKTFERLRVDERLPNAAKKNKRFAMLTKEFFVKNPDVMNIKSSEELKRLVDETINWKRLKDADIPIVEQFYRALRTALKEESENAALNIAGIANKELSAAFKNQKRSYGLLEKAKEISTSQEARELANRLISPSDYITGVGGLVAGAASGHDLESKIKNASLGALLGLANKGARTYGPQVQANTKNALSSILERFGKAGDGAVGRTLLFQSQKDSKDDAMKRRLRGN